MCSGVYGQNIPQCHRDSPLFSAVDIHKRADAPEAAILCEFAHKERQKLPQPSRIDAAERQAAAIMIIDPRNGGRGRAKHGSGLPAVEFGMQQAVQPRTECQRRLPDALLLPAESQRSREYFFILL